MMREPEWAFAEPPSPEDLTIVVDVDETEARDVAPEDVFDMEEWKREVPTLRERHVPMLELIRRPR